MMPWSEAYKTYETSEMYNNLHLNRESEEESPRRTYIKKVYIRYCKIPGRLEYKKYRRCKGMRISGIFYSKLWKNVSVGYFTYAIKTILYIQL